MPYLSKLTKNLLTFTVLVHILHMQIKIFRALSELAVKAVYLITSFVFKQPLIASLSIFLLLLSGTFCFAQIPQPPTFLTAQSDQDKEVPLFWFCPHPETSELVYHGDVMSGGVYVSSLWHDNCLAVRMNFSSAPFYLLRSRIYIPHQGISGDTTYDYKAFFFVTINPDSGGIPQNRFLDSVLTSATGEDSLSEGEWVDVDHNLYMQDSIFWVIFHWLEDSPLSPLVGVDDQPNFGNSFWGKRTFFHFEWHPTYHNLMIQVETVINPDTISDVDSFRVYRSLYPDSLMYQSNLIATVSGQHFHHTDSEVVNEQTYFYRVTSLNSEGESRDSNLAQATPKRMATLETDGDEFFVQVSAGQQIFETLNLFNSGGLPLWFKIKIGMDEADWMGGSDLFGYIWTDNNRYPDLEFAWVDIEDGGICLSDTGDDNRDYGFFDFGFFMQFYGNTLDRLRIGSDGWLSFSDLIPCYADTFKCYMNHPLPYLWGPYYLIAPFWDDLKLMDSSAIYFYSNNDSAIISYVNLHHYGQGGYGPYTFQTILTPDGEITFQYLFIDDSPYSATVGIQNQNGTVGLEILGEKDDLKDSLVIKIMPSWIRVDSMEGYIPPGESKTLNLTFDPLSYPQGVYQANLVIEGWDKNHQLETKIIPLTLCIDTTTSVEWTEAQKPQKITIFHNFPNPFNLRTTIQFTISRDQVKSAYVSLKIYNLLGQLVRTLIDEEISPGDHQIIWDGKDDKGKETASGIYFCRLKVGSYQGIRKLVLLK